MLTRWERAETACGLYLTFHSVDYAGRRQEMLAYGDENWKPNPSSSPQSRTPVRHSITVLSCNTSRSLSVWAISESGCIQ
eukprot:scaffold3321_cov149-Skeletonema_marinoi.AAC.15